MDYIQTRAYVYVYVCVYIYTYIHTGYRANSLNLHEMQYKCSAFKYLYIYT